MILDVRFRIITSAGFKLFRVQYSLGKVYNESRTLTEKEQLSLHGVHSDM